MRGLHAQRPIFSTYQRALTGSNTLVQVLLESHKEWYRRQRCKDPFEGLLGLDGLRKGPTFEHPFRRRVAGAAACLHLQ